MPSSPQLGIALVALVAAACVSPAPAPDPLEVPEGTPPPPRLTVGPWTEAFKESSVLIAEEIRISGPDRLAAQFVARQEPGVVDYDAETVTEGLRQIYSVVAPGNVIEGQLDAWRLVATQRLIVVQRPGPVDVDVVARGDVFFQRTDSPQPQRGPQFTHRGEIPWGP